MKMMYETWLETDLKKMNKVIHLNGNLFSQDNMSNKIGVHVFDNGEPVPSIGGTITGWVLRDDNSSVMVMGEQNGNDAWIILPEEAYGVPGPVSITIRHTASAESGAARVTLAVCTAYVYRTETDSVVDPGHVIPSISEIIEKIQQCEQATASANTAAENANTKAGLANTAAEDATLKAGRAQAAANTANTAANRLNNLTVSAQSGSTADAQVSNVDNHKHIAFTLPVGATPDISVAVTTRSPGTGATVEIDKTSPHSPEAPLITFGIPQGEPGSISNASGMSIPISDSDTTKIKTYVDNKNGANVPISESDATDIKSYVDSVSEKCKNLVAHRCYTLSNCQAGQYYNKTAETIAGYRFLCWLQPASQGFVACGMYNGSPWAKSGVFWCEVAGTYEVTAMYISTGE